MKTSLSGIWPLFINVCVVETVAEKRGRGSGCSNGDE
jgi:hypothetical protein